MKNKEKAFSIIKKTPLFANIDEKILLTLFDEMEEVHLQPDEYLMREEDPAEDFYIVIEGSLEVSKKGPARTEHAINRLGKGDTVGEMAIFDKDNRSASVKALKKATVIRIPFDKITSLMEKKPALGQIFMAIGREISSRLRYTNEVTVTALEQQINDFKMRVAMANFMVSIIFFLMLYIFIEAKITALTLTTTQPSKISTPILIVLIVLILIMIKSASISLATCGITLRNWKKALIESVLFTCPILLVITGLKWLGMHYGFSYAYFGNGLFDPYAGFHALPQEEIFRVWLTNLAFFCLFSVPLQELITRGTLQTSLETFLMGKHKTWLAIIISNAIFGSFQIIISVYLSMIVFIFGLFFGWLFSRHRTLIGVWVSHAMIGAWIFWILGIWVAH